MNRKPIRLLLVATAGVTVVAVAVHIYRTSPPAFMDLDVYREGVRAWWQGGDMYGPLPMTIAHNYLPFIYPPFAILFLAPLAIVPWTVSAVGMLAISLACLSVVVFLSVRAALPRLDGTTVLPVTAVLVALSLTTEPVWDTLWFGQINLLLMALVALDCLLPRTPWPRGALTGLAAAVKLTPAVFVIYFLLRKDSSAAGTMTAGALGATLLGFLVSWKGSLEFWFGHGGGARSVSGSPYYSNQTIDGFLARLGLPHADQTALWLAAVGLLLIVVAAGIRRAHRMREDAVAWSLTACFGLMSSPTSWGHHWVYAVPAAITIAGHAIEHRSARWTIACWTVVLTFRLGPYRLLPATYQHWRWWQQIVGNSYVLVGGTLLILFGLPALRRRPPSQIEPGAQSSSDSLSRAGL